MNTDERKAFGQQVRSERKARRWTQPELAERAHVSPGTISATERGLSVPQPSNLTSIAKELGIDLNGATPPATEPTGDDWWGEWFKTLPKDSRSTLYMIGLYLERLTPDDRDQRIREITTAIVEQRL